MILCILPCAVTRKRNNEEAPLGDAPVSRKRDGEGEREREKTLSNNHNVTLGCVTQKKSFLPAGTADLS